MSSKNVICIAYNTAGLVVHGGNCKATLNNLLNTTQLQPFIVHHLSPFLVHLLAFIVLVAMVMCTGRKKRIGTPTAGQGLKCH